MKDKSTEILPVIFDGYISLDLSEKYSTQESDDLQINFKYPLNFLKSIFLSKAFIY